jgi:hypothetical protein
MQAEKATSPFCVGAVVVAAVVVAATLATLGGPPPQPAASSETAATDARMRGRRERTMFGPFSGEQGKLTTAT